MRTQISKFVFAAAFGLAVFTLSCSSNDEQNSPTGKATNSTATKYCVYGEMRSCHSTSQSSCPVGGELSDFCPYDTPPVVPSSSSSSPVVRSSSSGGGSLSNSSSSANLSSSSVVLSSYTDKGNNIASYKIKKIGDQTWMAENLNYNVIGSRCYGEGGLVYNVETSAYDITLSNSEIETNCDKYGRLYDWATAMALPSKCNSVLSTSDVECAIATPNHRGICPSGWHIPSDADWNVLMKVANPSCSDNSICAGAGTKLKAREGWNSYDGPTGTDDFGFAALPGGYGNSLGGSTNAGSGGYWCSASEAYSRSAYYWTMIYSSEYFGRYSVDYGKGALYSVRCLQD